MAVFKRLGQVGMTQGQLLLVVVALACVNCELVNIKQYHSLILERHNDLRKNVSPGASDMRKMTWDDGLARAAENWARKCRYERPPIYSCDCGANLAYQRKHVHSPQSVRSNIMKGLQIWARERKYFSYGMSCGAACSYVQMIYSSTSRVGCAMNTCASMTVGDIMEDYATLFVCFYAPTGRIMSSYPYATGDACTGCPAGDRCSEGLCLERRGMVRVLNHPERLAELRVPITSEVALSPRRPLVPRTSSDNLTTSESFFLTQVHNMMRAQDDSPDLRWDARLQRWCDWIVNCKVDYPGPPHSYTNFYRCPDDMPIYEVVYSWLKEGRNTFLQLDKGCRTPYDDTHCNHYTTMMQPEVTSIACSARNCGDGTRQLVCIYDGPGNRSTG